MSKIIFIILFSLNAHGFIDEYEECEYLLIHRNDGERSYWKCADKIKMTNNCLIDIRGVRPKDQYDALHCCKDLKMSIIENMETFCK